MTIRFYIFVICLVFLGKAYVQAQCPVVDFTAPDTVCVGENFIIKNNGTNVDDYEWDFCFPDAFQVPTQQNIIESSLVNRIASIELKKQGNVWYGFAVDNANGKVLRLDFGENLDAEPTIKDLGNFNLLQNPIDIDIINDNGNWLAIVADFANSTLVLLDLGNSLENQPSAKSLGNFGVLNEPRSLEVEKDNGNWIGVITNAKGKSITLINWGVSVTTATSPSIINFTSSSLPRFFGLDIIRTNNGWRGITCSLDNNRVYRINFGANLYNTPIVSSITILQSSPLGVNLIEEDGNYIGLVNGFYGDLYRFDFGSNILLIPSLVKVNSSINFERRLNHNIIRNKGGLHLYSSDINSNKIDKLTFRKDCGQNIDYTEEVEPEITFFSSGDREVKLKVSNDNCTIDSTFSIYVKETVAPTLDIQVGNICESSITELSFVTDNPEDIITKTWTIENTTFTDDTINYTFPAPGTYPVTLEVESADGCGQRVTKDITIYEPPEPRFGVDKEVICTNGEIAFQNLTDTKGADEIITYAWDFNGEGTSNEANPSFTFTAGGSKTVILTASIPGCSNTYDTTFVVEQGPIVDFSTPPQICQGEAIVFENQTEGEGVTGYQWTFGDGGTYSSTALESPGYAYDSAGTYIAMLEVNNALGCANTLSKTITIYARPQAAFTADIACAGAPTQFADESTTGINSNVVAWNWDFGDGGGGSQARNPQYTYALPGVYEASLIVLTSAGCTDTLSQEIIVESAVQADFSAQTLCPEEDRSGQTDTYTVQFSDMSSVNDGEEITEWLWTINGENFVIADPSYSFETPGTYQISLTVFSETACNASVTKNIIIATPPTPDFSVVPNCAGAPVNFSNESLSEEVEISQYTWDFAGQGVSYDENPTFVFEEAGDYAVRLTLETTQGCQYMINKEVAIPAAPQAGFAADVIYGGAPLTVNFTNSSSPGTIYLWDFGAEGESSEENPSYTFTTPGTYSVSLRAESELNCTDIFTQEIKVVAPVTDLQLQKISILSEEGDPDVRLLLTISNLGTLAMSDFDMAITLDQVLTIHETFAGTLEPGETINYPLDFTISARLNQNIDLRYICATLEDLPQEVNIVNNRACASLNNTFSVVSPYPNPSGEQIKVDMVLPRQEVVRLSLITLRGEILKDLTFDNTKVGLNTFDMDVSTMVAGNYILQVKYQNHTETHRLMIKP